MRGKVYYDGYNFYYGYLKGHPELKWLNLVSFARALVKSDVEIVGVDYFTSRIKTYPHDQAAVERQKIYLQALSTLDGLRIQVVVFNPHANRRTELARYATYCADIPADIALQHQLPDEIPVGTHGNVIRRPAAWR